MKQTHIGEKQLGCRSKQLPPDMKHTLLRLTQFGNNMKKIFLCFVIIQQVSAQSNPNLAQKYGEEGEKKYRAKQYSEAIIDFTKAIEADNKNNLSYVFRGFCDYHLKNYSNTIYDLNKYLSLGGKEDLNKVYYRLGMAYFNLIQYNDAITYYTKCLNESSGDSLMEAEVSKDLALCYSQDLTKDSVQARYYILQSLAKNPKEVSTYCAYALIERRFNNCSKALGVINDCLKHIEIKSISTSFYYIRASAKACKQDTLGALADFEKAIHLNETDFYIYENRLRVLILNSAYDKTIKEDIGKAIIYCPDSTEIPYLYMLRAYVKIRDKDSLGAEQDLITAKNLNRGNVLMHYNLACYYLFERADANTLYKEKAIESLQKAILIDEKYLESYKLLALIYYKDDKDKKACEVLKKGYKQGNNEQIKNMMKVICNKEKENRDFNITTFSLGEGRSPLMKYIFQDALQKDTGVGANLQRENKIKN
jgi:tetratricopeptide (TPR) repeat protein